jgi:hypothetical protein
MDIDRNMEEQIDTAIVSGSDAPHDHGDCYEDDSSSDESEYEDNLHTNHHGNRNNNHNSHKHKTKPAQADPESYHYNPKQDEEDEAYVYRHLRGGTEETVTIRRRKTVMQQSGNESQPGQQQPQQHDTLHPHCTTFKVDTAIHDPLLLESKSTFHPRDARQKEHDNTFTLEHARVLKPRYSDAVLSCPCCLQIVCMDCQRHERYANQFRAMFVMNIGVSWDVFVIPENNSVQKVTRTATKATLTTTTTTTTTTDSEEESEDDHEKEEEDDDDERVYYSVYCNNCMTEVAALDMKDEVYYFFGCVASA